MKKVFLSLLAVCAGMILMSCSSLPKKATAGKNVVVGKVITEGVNYDGVYTPFNGKHTDENIVFLKSLSTGKEYACKCDKNGFFYSTKLPSDDTYVLSRIQLTVQLSNVITWINGTFSDKVNFKANDMTITNLGTVYYIFTNGGRGQCNIDGFDSIEKEYINSMVFGTDWERATIVRQNVFSDYEEWIRK